MKNETSNPLLERLRIPGQTFRLPSRGLFYNNGELSDDVVDGEVHVHPMTSYDEIVMKTPDMLFSGKAIEEVFSRCIPEIKDPSNLLAKDVDYLVVCLRVVTYGEKMEIHHTHECSEEKLRARAEQDAKRQSVPVEQIQLKEPAEHSYMVDVSKLIKNAQEIDPTSINKKYETKMPNGQVVKLQPMRYKHVVKLLQTLSASSDDVNPEQLNDELIFSIQSIIVSVDGISDSDKIRDWLKKIPSAWSHQINDTIKQVENWGATSSAKIKCHDCGSMVTIDVPINPLTFF